MLGEIALWSFVIVLVTGVFLTFWYKPSMAEVVYQGSYSELRGLPMSEAFASTLELSFDVRGGLLMRQIHHWAANLFIAAMMVHMLRVFFTGAFRKPRELNWMIGLALLMLGIVTEKNVVGYPMMPVYAAKAGGFFFIVFGVTALMGALLTINPIWLYGPYNPSQVTAGSQPDWYMGWLDGGLRLMPAWETELFGYTISWNVLVPGLLLLPLLFGLLGAYPFVERWVTGDRREHHLLQRPRNAPTRTALGVAGITAYGVLWIGAGNDIIAIIFKPEHQHPDRRTPGASVRRARDRLRPDEADLCRPAARRPRPGTARRGDRGHPPAPRRWVRRAAPAAPPPGAVAAHGARPAERTDRQRNGREQWRPCAIPAQGASARRDAAVPVRSRRREADSRGARRGRA